jgi:hypothetical protein
VDGRVMFRDPSMRLNAGQDEVVTVTLSSWMALAKGVVVGWRRNNETIGIGIVLD